MIGDAANGGRRNARLSATEGGRRRRRKALPAPRRGCGSGGRKAAGERHSQAGLGTRPGATRQSFVPRWSHPSSSQHRPLPWSRGKSRTRRRSYRCLIQLVRGWEGAMLDHGMDSRTRRCRLLHPWPSGSCKACRGSRGKRLEKDSASVYVCALCSPGYGVVSGPATVPAAASSCAEGGRVAQCILAEGCAPSNQRSSQGCHSLSRRDK